MSLLSRYFFYGVWAAPAFVFHKWTSKEAVKKGNRLLDGGLLILPLIQVAIPLLYNGRPVILDSSIMAVCGILIAAQMLSFANRRRRQPLGGPVKPFHYLPTRWYVHPTKPVTIKPDMHPTIGRIRAIALTLLAKSLLQLALFVPVMCTLDGFLRRCIVPPNTFTNTTYLSQLTRGHIDPATIYYHFVAGFTLHLHVAIVPTGHVLFRSIRLACLAWYAPATLPPSPRLVAWYNSLVDFISQAPLFDKPWLSRSIHELWSQRWHQLFRAGFQDIAYRPIRRLFGRYKTLGRAAGTIAVFTLSGWMHDYILLCMIGYRQWHQPGVLGYQTLFFVLQGIAALLSHPAMPGGRLPPWLAHALTILWILLTAPLFVEPYIRIGLHHHAEVPGFPRWMDPYIGVVCPFGTAP